MGANPWQLLANSGTKDLPVDGIPPIAGAPPVARVPPVAAPPVAAPPLVAAVPPIGKLAPVPAPPISIGFPPEVDESPIVAAVLPPQLLASVRVTTPSIARLCRRPLSDTATEATSKRLTICDSSSAGDTAKGAAPMPARIPWVASHSPQLSKLPKRAYKPAVRSFKSWGMNPKSSAALRCAFVSNGAIATRSTVQVENVGFRSRNCAMW